MKYLLTLACAIPLLVSAQTDTSLIYNAPVLRPGLYRTYQEFITNSPSIAIPFDITYVHMSKKDSTIVGATYTLTDSAKDLGRVWGFCDGRDVYIDYTISLIGRHKFWRVESLGPHPFFSFLEKNVAAMGPPLMGLATGVLTATKPADFKLRTITEKGSTNAASIKTMQEWLAPEPDLLAAFNRTGYKHPSLTDPHQTEPRYPDSYEDRIRVIREYLLKLNQRLVARSRQP